MTIIKICGIKTLDDAITASKAGADMLGFNFHPKSVRFIEVGACRDVMQVLRGSTKITCVGVFVNAPAAEIRATLDTCGLSLAQLHGDETQETLDALDGRAFKAFRGIPAQLNGFARSQPPAFLIDAAVDGAYGGTGVTADWSAAAELAKRYPLLLAGGLKSENVAAAVRQVRPWGVDVASGVESSPGRKDAGRIKAFIEAVRNEESREL
jgi:phosphoribosylanthranilate isomerase